MPTHMTGQMRSSTLNRTVMRHDGRQPMTCGSVQQRVVCAATTVILSLLAVAPAIAQESTTAPRQPSVREFPAAWVGYGAMVLIAGLILMVSLHPSKRSQQKD
ncbi:MAG: hypothetical protein EXS15_03135 [Phycisphaerales bacterium]|nr:hypothetical protein [Phycisphaerales bacterium]